MSETHETDCECSDCDPEYNDDDVDTETDESDLEEIDEDELIELGREYLQIIADLGTIYRVN